MKREYRGQRSVVAIADFIRQQQVDPVKEMHSLEEINTLDVSEKNTCTDVKKKKRKITFPHDETKLASHLLFS